VVFSSLLFIYIFLPVSLILYFAVPGMRAKNIILTLLSLVFYAWGEPVWVTLLIFSSAIGYINGLIIEKHRGTTAAKLSLAISVVVNLGLLASFKYGAFITESLNSLFGIALPVPKIALPIGISFFTFQTMTYSIDMYRGRHKAQRSFLDFLLFVSLFPQLIAGPIVRYSDIENQISVRKSDPEEIALGSLRFVCGLSKKVLLANYAGAVADKILTSTGAIPVTQAWLGVLLYAFHIYFDFSGYSDMAIGMGHIFGFTYPENFRYPYISHSITEFWRRWHMTLSSFFRDYVYIPLGGNRRHQLLNMLIVWSLTGLWHGASWSFVVWGLYFFVLLALEKYVLNRIKFKLPRLFAVLITFFFVCIGWVFFYYQDFNAIMRMLGALLGANGAPISDAATGLLWINNLLLFVFCVVGSTPLPGYIGSQFLKLRSRGKNGAYTFTVLSVGYIVILMLLCTISLAGSTNNPFIYFRF
jgi:alginate O-acetyltransferase complex protein AlgI